MEIRKKELKVTFFITGQENKSKSIITGELFDSTWEKFNADTNKVNALTDTKPLGENRGKKLVLKLNEYDKKEEIYFGFIGIYRNTILPTVFNKKSHDDSNIPLTEDDEILEKSYFLYYVQQDILVFHQNHLGPRADDLAYMLFKFNELDRVHFDPIWKKNNVKELLETNNVMKKGTITLALPRNFNEAELDLSNNWNKEVIGMMSRTGMSRMSINFWGRASTKKGNLGYLVNDVKKGVQELVSKFSVSERTNQPILHKASIQINGGGVESLLEQELSTKVDIAVENGYPKTIIVKQGLHRAKLKCKDSLNAYIVGNKDHA
jgi:hypothetical protein